jgi:hypothetical protein
MSRLLFVVSAAALLAACSPDQPRAVSYFKDHPDEAGKVVADCSTGAHRGAECINATEAQAQIRSDARMSEYKKSF